MYVAVKGGATAILNSHALLAELRRGDPAVPELGIDQIREQSRLAVDRVMTEGSVYDPELAALALKQAAGDAVEAIFLLRAHRTTLPRLGYSLPLDTGRMQLWRRVSAAFKDLPGGQILGPTYDYTQRLLDFSLLASGEPPVARQAAVDADLSTPSVIELLARGNLFPPARGVACLAGLRERTVMRIGVAIRALREWNSREARCPARSRRRVALGARDLGVETGQRKLRLRMVNLGRRFPVHKRMTAQAVLPELAVMNVLVARRAVLR